MVYFSYLEVHPNHRKQLSVGSFVKLVFGIGDVTSIERKRRTVRFEVRTAVDVCVWNDHFDYFGSVRRTKDDFMNQIYVQSYLTRNDLILHLNVEIKETEMTESVNDSIAQVAQRGSKLVRDIHSLATSEMLSDFTFIIDKRELKVHKAILAGEQNSKLSRLHCSMPIFLSARSPVFERMFNGNFREATSASQEIEDISADTFEEFLYFLYAGDFRNKDFPVDELIRVADRYEVMDLVEACERKLMKEINSQNAEAIYEISNQIRCDPRLNKLAFDVLAK